MFRFFSRKVNHQAELLGYLADVRESHERRGEYLGDYDNYLAAIKSLKRLRGVTPYSRVQFSQDDVKAVKKALRRLYNV